MPSLKKDVERLVDSILSDGVADVIVKADLKKKLLNGKKLRIKLGIDPTGSDLHLGHLLGFLTLLLSSNL